MARVQETAGGAQEETRTERVTIAVTPTERRAVRAVAAIRGTEESNLVRTTTIADIVTEFERLRGDADGEAA